MNLPNKYSFYDGLKKHPVVMVLLITGILIRLAFVVLLPFGQNVRFHLEGLNDEPSHFNYVKYLAINKQFPVQTESVQSPNAFEQNTFEYYQPPLYYLLCASVYPWLKDSGTLYFGRFLSFLAGLFSVIVLYKIITFLEMPVQLKTAASVFSLFQLSNVYFCSVLSNDSLSWLLALLICWYLLIINSKLEKKLSDKRWKESFALAILLGVGMLVKSSTFVFFPVVCSFYLILFVKEKKTSILIECIVIMLIASIIAFPWYYRNWLVYHSLFALHIGFGPETENMKSLIEWRYALSSTILRFWFPMQHLERTFFFKVFKTVASGVVLVHVLAPIFYVIRGRNISQKMVIQFLIFFISLSAYVKLLVSWPNPEARYLFQAWAPIMYFWFLPLIRFTFRWNFLLTITICECLTGYLFFIFT